MSYSISVLNDPNRINELITLFEKGLGETTAEHWKWRLFTDNGQQDPPVALIADDESGKMVGMSTVLPVSYCNGEYKCLQYCDWVVDPEHRGKGLVSKFINFYLEAYSEKGYDFLLGFPNSASFPIFKKNGFDFFDTAKTWVTPKKLIVFPSKEADVIYNDYTFTFSDTIPADVSGISANRVDRSNNYLKWKYDLNPNYQFKWLTIRKNGEFFGYIVFNIMKGRLNSAVNIYDFDLKLFESDIFSIAVKMLTKLGNFVTLWGSFDNETKALFKKSGLTETESETRIALKALSNKGYPENLVLTRADTDY